ncbi:hypothetical protein BZG23_08285 [Salinivibrio sp. ML290]|nr:hypothetical protein BZG23_08285 [Salinivibrio sp. ML290]
MPFKFGFMLCMNDSRIKDDNNLLSVIGSVRDKSSGYLSKSDYIENLKSENIEQCQVKIKVKEPVKDNSLMSAKDISDWIISLPDSRIGHHVINTLIGYIYGIEFSKDYPLSGLIISNQNDHDGSSLIILDNTLSPVTDDKIKSVKYKLLIHGILTTIYLICFALFLLGIVRDKRVSLNQYNK